MLDQEIVAGSLHGVKLLVGFLPHPFHQNLCAVNSKLPSLCLGKRGVKLFPVVSWSDRIRTYGIGGIR